MAEPAVKDEPASPPPSGPSAPGDASGPSTISQNNQLSTYRWKRCDGESKIKRVFIKERAAQIAESALREMLPVLRGKLESVPTAQLRIDRIGESLILLVGFDTDYPFSDEILSRKKDHHILVGFLGDYGRWQDNSFECFGWLAQFTP